MTWSRLESRQFVLTIAVETDNVKQMELAVAIQDTGERRDGNGRRNMFSSHIFVLKKKKSGINCANSVSALSMNAAPVQSSVSRLNWTYFTLQVPAGQARFVVQTTQSNASQDVDLYVRFNAVPTRYIFFFFSTLVFLYFFFTHMFLFKDFV